MCIRYRGFGDNASFTAVFGEDVLGTVGLNVYHYTAADTEVNDWLVERHFEKYKDAPDAAINAYPDLFTAGGMASVLPLLALPLFFFSPYLSRFTKILATSLLAASIAAVGIMIIVNNKVFAYP